MRAESVPRTLNEEGGVVTHAPQNVAVEAVDGARAGLDCKQQAYQSEMRKREQEDLRRRFHRVWSRSSADNRQFNLELGLGAIAVELCRQRGLES